jgi:hypothetical protein
MRNKGLDVDLLLREAMKSSAKPNAELIGKVKRTLIKEDKVLKKSAIRRSFSAAAIIAAVLALTATTALAAWYFMKPGDVATKVSDNSLSAAFDSETAVNINESATSGGYTFTLLAVASGNDISDMQYFSNGELQSDRSYAILAIQKTDGTPFDNQNAVPFFASPLIKGTNPAQVNAMSMDGGYSDIISEGVLYRIVQCDNVEIFADYGLYFAVCEGPFYNSDAFIWNEQTGEIKSNPDSEAASAVFDLPIDKKFSNPEKAEQYLKSLFPPPDADGGETWESSGDGIDDPKLMENDGEEQAPPILQPSN